MSRTPTHPPRRLQAVVRRDVSVPEFRHEVTQQQAVEPEGDGGRLHVGDGARDGERSLPLWLTTRQVMTDVLFKSSMKATYCWLDRHGIGRRGDGRISKVEIQRVLARGRRRRAGTFRKTA